MTDTNQAAETGAALDSPTSEFCLRMARAWAALSRRLDSSLGSLHGISFSDYQLLLNLHRAPGGRLRRVDLAEKLGLTASGVTRSLLPLEKIGLVGRQSDPRDARVGYAIITPTGSELVVNASVVVHNVSRMLLGAPSRNQIESTSTLLAQLAGSQQATTLAEEASRRISQDSGIAINRAAACRNSPPT